MFHEKYVVQVRTVHAELLDAFTPGKEEQAEISAINEAVAVEICSKPALGFSESRQDLSEISTIDDAVAIEVGGAIRRPIEDRLNRVECIEETPAIGGVVTAGSTIDRGLCHHIFNFIRREGRVNRKNQGRNAGGVR